MKIIPLLKVILIRITIHLSKNTLLKNGGIELFNINTIHSSFHPNSTKRQHRFT